MKPICACGSGTCVRIAGGTLNMGGPDRRIEDAAGKVWIFEDHPRFGPVVLNSRGNPTAQQPGGRSAFWPAWQAWKDQGKRLQIDGLTCLWEAPPAPELVHLGGRNYALARSKLAQRYGRD